MEIKRTSWNKGLTKATHSQLGNAGPKKGQGAWLGKKRDMPWLKEYNFKKGSKPPQYGQSQDTFQNDILNRIIETDNCIEWNNYRDVGGYGIFRFNGKLNLVHRLVWELKNGFIPKAMEICHHCDNPSCFNPKHLFIGTHRDNMLDMKYKYRQSTSARSLLLKGSIA